MGSQTVNVLGRRATTGQPVAIRCDDVGRVEVTGGGGGGAVTVIQPDPNLLNANANMQVGDMDVANGNPVPVSDAGGTLTVDQATHDLLNANANMQVGDMDVANGNPVPVSDAGGSLTVDLAAGENHAAEVGASGATIVVQLVNTLPAYVAGDCVGGLIEVANVGRIPGGHQILNSLTLWDRDGQEERFNVYLFTANPTNSTFTDANPVVVHANDRALIVPGTPFRIFEGDYIAAQSGGSGATKANMGISFELAATSMWMAYEAVHTPDYVNTDALTTIMDLLRD